MTPQLASRLYNSAYYAVVNQFPNLSILELSELTLDELDYRFGKAMTDEIINFDYTNWQLTDKN